MKFRSCIKDLLLTLLILTVSFAAVVLIQKAFDTEAMAPMIFVMAVFLVSLVTHGYLWGITASLVSVLAVNFAFTFPYFEFNFSLPENMFSGIVMLFVAVMTSALTTNVKNQERMRAENEKEKMRANLLRAVSHDLRTPLTSIYGSCSTIMENYDSLDKEQQLKLLSEVCEDAEWLNRMVENLLSVTRINSGTVSVKKVPTVLEELIDAVLVKFRKHYPEWSVTADIPESFIIIPMDSILIEQVLINLLENAVNHAFGMTKLILRVFTLGNRAVFEVIDDGCGIPQEKLDTLFSGSMEKDAPAVDRSKHSMGIGLSVCATIIKAHGGELCVESKPNRGTTFRFSLEMEDSEHEQQ
ncbi:MAG TPA: sensor histidine kinase [Clostridiales bacterium]|nr:sensor histidine kinase [Clostridiales bacterium]